MAVSKSGIYNTSFNIQQKIKKQINFTKINLKFYFYFLNFNKDASIKKWNQHNQFNLLKLIVY